MKTDWQVEDQIISNYLEACDDAVADNIKFQNFKADPRYKPVLEHVPESDGTIYYEFIKKNRPELFNKLSNFKINDDIGNPQVFQYENIKISPTTLRYVYTLGDILYLINKKKYFKRPSNIIEIGGGYGGQCLVISEEIKFKNYTILDLPSPTAVQRKYLDTYQISNVTFEQKGEYDLFISNYAFTELSRDLQDKYIDSVISRVPMGYMQCNSTYYDSYSISDLKNKIQDICRVEILLADDIINPNNKIMLWSNYDKQYDTE